MYAFNLHIPFKFKECILQWFTGSQHGLNPLLLTNPKTETHSIHSIHNKAYTFKAQYINNNILHNAAS